MVTTWLDSFAGVCCAKCTRCVYILWYFYQLITHKELRKCVKESKQQKEFLHCIHKQRSTARRWQFRRLYWTMSKIAPMTRRTRYAVYFRVTSCDNDILFLVCLHSHFSQTSPELVRNEPRDSPFQGVSGCLFGADQGLDDSIHTYSNEPH